MPRERERERDWCNFFSVPLSLPLPLSFSPSLHPFLPTFPRQFIRGPSPLSSSFRPHQLTEDSADQRKGRSQIPGLIIATDSKVFPQVQIVVNGVATKHLEQALCRRRKDQVERKYSRWDIIARCDRALCPCYQIINLCRSKDKDQREDKGKQREAEIGGPSA